MELKNQLINLIQTEQWPQTAIIDNDNHEFLSTTSQELVQVLICPKHSFPFDQCLICQRYQKGILPNILSFKSSEQQLKKDNLKTAMQQLSLFALEEKIPKILLIDLGEDLNLSTANSLLKFLEEPPQNTFILILSQNYSQILSTIRSRCQRFHFPNQSENKSNSLLEKIITTNNQKEFLDLSYQWSKLPKEDLIVDINKAYKNLIRFKYPQLATSTLILLDDLKNWSFDSLAITNYLIILESLIGNSYENL